jgi:DNA polymerase-3 subunit alpha
MSQPADFVHLHVHSAYSLAEGALRTKEIVELCCADKMPAVAVTDSNNMFGALEFSLVATEKGVQPIIGCQINVGEAEQQLVLLVQNQTGYLNLSKLVSDAYMEGDVSKLVATSLEELVTHNDGLICLSGGAIKGFREEKDLLKLKQIFGDRFYIEIQRHGLREEELHETALIDLAITHNIPLVATNDAYFSSPEMHEAHDALLCISAGRYITEDDRRKVTKEHHFKTPDEMIELFKDLPEAIQNTVKIAQRCSFILKEIAPLLPPFETESGRNEESELKAQVREGLEWRLDNFENHASREDYFKRMDFELSVINDMGFPGYFLICADFIQWAKDHNIPVGPGRGSGAGSVVAWSLKITDLDPLQFNLLFERFLNPERLSMPDFDIDFCQDRRGEVISYVQEKYGKDRVAQIITFGKLQARAVVRDVGRVLQMPYGLVDRIAKMIPNNPAQPTTLQEALDADPDFRLEIKKDELSEKLINIALKLEGLFRHASTHAAGLVIGDRPLHELVPLYRDPRSDMPVTQFNMKYVEQAGLVKFDFLGLKTLTVIQKAVEFIKETKDEDIDVLKIPFDDEKTFSMVSKGDSVGVFQLESAGMRDLGRQMKLSAFEQIIAMVALYRPGPMENIPKYLACLNGKEERDFMHPKLEPILEETYGVMIYQEQVLQAAQILAGYSLGAADLLRKAMGKKIQAVMDAEREKFVSGAFEHNQIDEKTGNHIFDQIAKFAGYGFNKAHSACYAFIAYQTAWLKANYPVEFMAASMTLDYGNTDKLSVFKQELDRMEVDLLPPDINKSGVMFRVEEGMVRYALAALKGVGEGAMEKIIVERDANGAYKDMADFIGRLDSKVMNKRQFDGLICSGAFDSFNPNRAELYGNMEMLLRHASALAEERESGQSSLFGGPEAGVGGDMPDYAPTEPWDALEKLAHEFKAVGFYLSAHPLDARMDQLQKMGVTPLNQVAKKISRSPSGRVHMAGILIRKQERVSAKTGNKFAFLQLSDSTGVYEVMIFSETLARSREFLVPGTGLLINADAEMKDEELRFLGQIIQPLDEAMANKVRSLKIHIDAAAPIQRMHDILKVDNPNGGAGNVKIHLYAHLEEGHIAEMEIKGKYNIPQDMMSQLQKTAGYVKHSEG